jgi:integrase/recombinase XerD
MLGHAALSSTERYTHVAIAKLQQIHAATHPAKLTRSGAMQTLATNEPAPTREALLDAILSEDEGQDAAKEMLTNSGRCA